MSTRCQISVEGNKAYIYQHSDGYPSGVLPLLVPFVNRFMQHRGFDSEYLAARLVQHLTNESDREMAEMYARMEEKPRAMEVLGFGIDTELHGDIEYLYTVRKDGSVEVRDADFRKGPGEKPTFVVPPKTAEGDLKALLKQVKAD